MMIAPAFVKPLTTGWERKLTTRPSLRAPRANWKARARVIGAYSWSANLRPFASLLEGAAGQPAVG